MKAYPFKYSLVTSLLVLLLFSCNALRSVKKDKIEPLTFVQMCDTQLGMGGYKHDLEAFKSAVHQINTMKPDFVVICGDLVHHATDSSYNDFLSVMKAFHVPCHVAPGNHDVKNKPTHESLAYYRNKIGADYYRFKSGNYGFLVTNTQLWKTATTEESEKHQRWFEKSLKKYRRKETFIIGHYPLYTEFSSEEEHYFNLPLEIRDKIFTLLEKYQVKAYLSGHTHKLVINNYRGIQLVSGETTSKNFDERPLGFRKWTAVKDSIYHQFIPLESVPDIIVE